MTASLASGLHCGQLNTHLLRKPHELCGSGFHIPSTMAAVLSFLSAVELKCDVGSIPRSMPPADLGCDVLKVPQNGRCFVCCLHLATQLQETHRVQWEEFLRSNTSMPVNVRTGETDQKRLKLEERCSSLPVYLETSVSHCFQTYAFVLFCPLFKKIDDMI